MRLAGKLFIRLSYGIGYLMGARMDRDDLAGVTVAFQVIVNMHSGLGYGYEILLRGWEPLGFAGAEAMVEAAAAAGLIGELEGVVRRFARTVASRLPDIHKRVLFANLDQRAEADWPRLAEAMAGIAAQTVSEITALPHAMICPDDMRSLQRAGGLVAVDRFGYSQQGLVLLHACEPDFVKFDRTLIRGIDRDTRKRVVLSQLISMAHILGVQTIAVGVETSREFRACRELGCDLAQGFFIQAPTTDPGAVASSFPQIAALAAAERRRRNDVQWVSDHLDTPPAIRSDAPLREVFERFARHPNSSYIPVVDTMGRPLGILCERNLKNYAYSTYGKDLIANKQLGRTLLDFLVRCPTTDLGTPLDQMLAIYAGADEADGILMTREMVYHGFLSAGSLVRAMHERTVTRAREQNPLTKLPGNSVIDDYIRRSIATANGATLAYIDFDNFKPFNDTYGFRQGDRAILLFAELCRKHANPQTWFIGHIGGDDFFIGIQGSPFDEAMLAVRRLIDQFASDAESFYDAETRTRGSIVALDRDGNTRSFPLLSASAVLFELPPGATGLSIDSISATIAGHKKQAKASPDRIAVTGPRRG